MNVKVNIKEKLRSSLKWNDYNIRKRYTLHISALIAKFATAYTY